MTQLTPQDGIAIVTGAGSGLGRAMAVGLSEKGFTVVGTGRQLQPLQETAALCTKGRFVAEPLDVADARAVSEGFARIVENHGPIALLINNAAVYPHRDFLEESPESFMQTVAINLGGVVHCSHAALRDMAARGRGRILNVATFADLNPLPSAGAYSVSKGAARILTRALIADLGDRFPGIVIGDWMPGMLRTGMGIPDGLAPEQAAKWGVKLALMRDPALTGAVFEMDREILPLRGIKGKIKDLILMRRRRPRQL
ncbi:SDR family oxidoreductase [Tropicibacter oceani]|uniref:SDR family NAD(P)-dependent oxidoreductase n=1 Tax=Tropicibacter oceani TaxID=3058420 RepID=A0ABY8QJ35_9RHOB|nr:SDR family NAD(P)-dependent oxidoreductase [Tropicibacter oceani]WGW04453.1 SDR family NAD(P)-dependent oxidoreductase [Tropicibacter oceani]